MPQKLTHKQQDQINQVKATMAIENMQLDKDATQNLIDLATGRKTKKQIIAEIIQRAKEREANNV